MLARPRSAPPTASLLAAYQSLLDGQGLAPDAAQAHAVVRFQRLADALRADTVTGPKGIYFHGPVGRGKSMLMNLFFDHVTLPKRRVHMHAFMAELHTRLHTTTTRPGQDLMTVVAGQIAAEATLLCFDEFYITNIADAMILGRLFQALFAQGVVIVCTSNWPPEELFQGGVNRDRFMPFIKLIRGRLEEVDIGAGRDYRQPAAGSLPPYYIVPRPGLASEPQLAVLFAEFSRGTSTRLSPDLAPKRHEGRCVWFTFDSLCDRAYGREHYLELARACDTLILEGVPVFTAREADAALRLVTLVDIFYEQNRRMVVSAAAEPAKLCTAGDAAEPFRRAASRLMQLAGAPRPAATPGAGAKVTRLPSPRARKSRLAPKRKKPTMKR